MFVWVCVRVCVVQHRAAGAHLGGLLGGLFSGRRFGRLFGSLFGFLLRRDNRNHPLLAHGDALLGLALRARGALLPLARDRYGLSLSALEMGRRVDINQTDCYFVGLGQKDILAVFVVWIFEILCFVVVRLGVSRS